MRTTALRAIPASLLAAICCCANIAPAAPVLEFSPGGPYAVTTGASFSVDVDIANLAGNIVSAYDFGVQYNPALLGSPSVTFGPFLGNASLFEVLEDAVPGAGSIELAVVSLLDDAGLYALQAPNDKVYLATLNFVALADGAASLNFAFGLGQDVKCSNATQCIPSIPEPSSIALLLTALIGYCVTTRATAPGRRTFI